ncbi:MAG: hypothetical protein ACRCY3_15530 [Sphingorhabdus sp.]
MEAHFESMNARQEQERAKGRSCAARSKIKSYKKEFFPSDQKILAIEFPDGVRGGRGKINGIRPLNSLDDAECGRLEFERCAGVQMYAENGWDHMWFIAIPSSNQDSKVVQCALDNLAGYFNVGLSNNDPTEFNRMNEEPFAQLHQKIEKSDAQKN